MKPIETIYNGYRFRSRLEARWAVFFDAMGIKYEYEPEGFVLSNGIKYLPDFFLPTLNVYLEVKHTGDVFIRRKGDFVEMKDKFVDKYGRFINDCTGQNYGVWFVFGDPCNALKSESNWLFCHHRCKAKDFAGKDTTCLCNGEEVKTTDCDGDFGVGSVSVLALADDMILTNSYSSMTSDDVPMISVENLESKDGVINEDFLEALNIVFDFGKMSDGMKHSRQARFEHGEELE